MSTHVQSSHCPIDGFPLLLIDDEQYCSVEYADSRIGGQEVSGVSEADGYIILEFSNGASMPVTCPCCGGRMHLRHIDVDDLNEMISGRIVEGFRHGEWVGHGTDDVRHPIFALQFTGTEDLRARTLHVHLETVRRITVPGCNPD